MKVEIREFDNDYRAYCGSEILEFIDLNAAKVYCEHHSWTGYSYTIGWYEGK